MSQMAEWAWVAAGYTITLLALGGYVLVLLWRAARTRRRREELR